MKLKWTDCPACLGEGYSIYFQIGFSDWELGFEPQECHESCRLCLGEGRLELCVYCKEPPQIEQGQEICACTAASLAKAA